MTRKIYCMFFFSLFMLAVAYANNGFLVLTQGHSTGIESLAVSHDGQYGFSGDASGIIKVWDLNANKTVRIIRAGTGKITNIVVHPNRSEIAVVEEQGEQNFRLSAWDWFEGQFIFTRNMEALPSKILYSPQGSFLVSVNSQLNSLNFFEGNTGRDIPYLENEFERVDFVIVSNSEQRIMTYNALNGAIRYLELESSEVVHETQSENRLSMLQVLQNRRYAIGYKNQEIFLIDLLNGTTMNRVNFGPIESLIPINADDDQFYIAQENGRQQNLSLISINPQISQSIRLRQRNTLRVSGFNVLYASSDTRTILSPNQFEIAVIENRRYRTLNPVEFDAIQNILIHNEWIYVHSLAGISRFPRIYLKSEEETISTSRSQELETINLSIENPSGMKELDANNILIWDRNNRNNIVVLNTDSLQELNIPIQLFSPVRSVHIGTMYILVIDQENILYILDRNNNFEPIYTYQDVSIHEAIEINQSRILIARESDVQIPFSLIELNIESGEIIPIQSNDDRIISIQPYSDGFYTLGLNTQGEEIFTNVQQFSWDRLQIEPIIQFPSELDRAEILYSNIHASLFSTVALEGVYEYSDREFRSFELDNQRATALYANEDSLFAINSDGSVTTWSLENGLLQSQLYLRHDNYVISLYPNEEYIIIERPGRRNSLGHLLSSEISN